MPLSFTQKVLVFGATTVLLVLAGVLFASRFVFRKNVSPATLIQMQSTEQTPVGMRVVSGMVEKISGQEVTIKTGDSTRGAVANSTNQTDSVVIVVDQATMIERLAQKDSATISRELNDFVGKMKALGPQDSTDSITPPETFTRETATLSDIKIGSIVSVVARADASKPGIVTATEIEIQYVAAATPKAQ